MTNKSGLFFAAKGGYNNESHNHNDAGTFSLYLHTTPVFIDAGVGTYTRQTFSSERYTIWTMQSNYHNLPMINGVPNHSEQNIKQRTSLSIRKAVRSQPTSLLLTPKKPESISGFVPIRWAKEN